MSSSNEGGWNIFHMLEGDKELVYVNRLTAFNTKPSWGERVTFKSLPTDIKQKIRKKLK